MRARHLIATPTLLALHTLLPAQAAKALRYGSPHERQFDFWVGEWDVHNRSLGKDSQWRPAGRARARIRPILGGKAILEEWNGKDGQRANTFGMSVRCYHPGKKRWVIMLCWPNPRYTGFGHMEGSFRHGRAEFFPPTAFQQPVQRAERFTFSDALPDTCRWDMAQPTKEGGWRTTWIMEFTRTKSAKQTIADGEPIARPPATPVCAGASAREFDRMLGVWQGQGHRYDAAGTRSAVSASYRISSTNRGCSVHSFLDVKAGDAFAERRFTVWAYQRQAGKWVARTLDDRTPEFQVLVGTFESDPARTATFLATDRRGNPLPETRRIRFAKLADRGFRLTHERSSDGGKTWRPALELAFEPQK